MPSFSAFVMFLMALGGTLPESDSHEQGEHHNSLRRRRRTSTGKTYIYDENNPYWNIHPSRAIVSTHYFEVPSSGDETDTDANNNPGRASSENDSFERDVDVMDAQVVTASSVAVTTTTATNGGQSSTLTQNNDNNYWAIPEREPSEIDASDNENPYWSIPGRDRTESEMDDSSGGDDPVQSQTIVAETVVNNYITDYDEIDMANAQTTDVSESETSNNIDYNPTSYNKEQQVFVNQCLDLLEAKSVDEKVDRDQYVGFLEELSRGSLKAREFKDLPLFLSMIFFSAGCSHGEDCVDDEPALVVPRSNGQQQVQDKDSRATPQERDVVSMNHVLCHQLVRYPFLEVLMPFQFLIRVSNGLSASELMMVSENESNRGPPIVPNLESALDQALLEGFNCSYSEPYLYKPKMMVGTKRKPVFNGQNRQPQSVDECDFLVEVTVSDAADYRKFPSGS